MSSAIVIPKKHPVFNEFDDIGILLGIERINGEDNLSYRKRIEDVFVHRADSTYIGLIYGITRDLGLSLFEAMSVSTLNTDSAIIVKDSWCSIYSAYSLGEAGLSAKFDLYDRESNTYTLNGLLSAINTDGTFTASLESGIDGNLKAGVIFNQSNVLDINQESINSKGTHVRLNNSNIIDNTVAVSSLFLKERVLTQINLKPYQYYIDLVAGILICGQVPELGATINYKSQKLDFKFKASPVIISSLHSEGMAPRLFDQNIDSNGVVTKQNLTLLGTDIMNEIISVYPYLYGQ